MRYGDVEKMVEELKNLYPNVYFEIEYIKEDNNYVVKLNDAEFAHSDKLYDFIGKKLIKSIQAEEVFNVFFCYDSKLEEKITMQKINFVSNFKEDFDFSTPIRSAKNSFNIKEISEINYIDNKSELSMVDNFVILFSDKNSKESFSKKYNLESNTDNFRNIQNFLAA